MQTPIAQIVRGNSNIRVFLVNVWNHRRRPTALELDLELRAAAQELAITLKRPVYYVRVPPAFWNLPTIVIVEVD